MRAWDQSPAWRFSANWSNGQYDVLHQFLTGQIDRATYDARVPKNYGFNDVYGFHRLPTAPANFAAQGGDCYFSGDTYHSLAAKYFSTRDARYLSKYLAIQSALATSERQAYRSMTPEARQTRVGCSNMEADNAGALLANGWDLMAIGQALASMAKAADRAPTAARWGVDSVLPVTRPITDPVRQLFPADTLYQIAGGLFRSYAPDLLQNYAPPRHIPNQRISGLVGLGLLGDAFRRHPDVASFQPRLDNALRDVIVQTAQKDGGLLEPSLNYNLGSITEISYLARTPGHVWTAPAAAAVRNFRLMEAAISTPQGGLPQIGNNLWSSGSVRDGVAFTQTSIALPYSGYYVQRSGWDPQAGYLFFYGKRLARGHGMNGDNAIELGAFGRRLLIAGGIPNYGDTDAAYPKSVAYRDEDSTFKTSTVVVDGKSQQPSTEGVPRGTNGHPDGNLLPATPVAARWSSSATFDVVDRTHTGGYAGLAVQDVTHQRSVVFIRDILAWVVVDVLRSPSTHAYTQVWKFAQPQFAANGQQSEGFTLAQVALSETARTIRTHDTTTGAVNLSLRQFGAPTNLAAFDGHDGGPYGYVGTSFTDGPGFSPDVHATLTASGDQVLITVLHPFQGSDNDGMTNVQEVSAGGVAGAELKLGGSSVSIRATATAATLSAGGQSAAGAQLLVVEQRGGVTRSVVLGPAAVAGASYESGPGGRTPIGVPSGFAWRIEADGRYTALYE